MPLSELQEYPFNLKKGDEILARIHAKNVKGVGEDSNESASGNLLIAGPGKVEWKTLDDRE